MATARNARPWIPALALLAGLTAAIPAPGQTPKPVTGTSRTPAQQLAATRRVWLPVFAFRSGFWVNLHHFLYLQARLERGMAVSVGAAPSPEPAASNPSTLSPAERAAWQDAVDYYADHFAGYDLMFDSYLVRVDDQLGGMAYCADLSGKSTPNCDAGLAPDLTAVLDEAASVYRAHWWPAQDQANQAWIAQADPLVRQYGGKIAELLALVYGVGWPADPIPIDVTDYAGQFGVYTTLDPVHVTVSSVDPGNQGAAALEVIFRASSSVLATGIEQAIIDQCHSRTKPIPRDLWPALVAYTAGRAVAAALAGQPAALSARGSPRLGERYTGYVTERGWEGFEDLIERFWQPHLDGKIDSETAIARLVAAL